jgi:class 3 adenylate cyclase/predicted ATPase
VKIAAWLSGLGLERYVEAFEGNDIDAAVLRTLNADDLRELGVASLGHRKKLLDAIAALRAPAGVPTATAAAPTARAAERRQLTVLFCDLVGSTALASRLDPEDLREVITAYHGCVTEIVAGLDGFVAKYMGDGVLVYFGYPHAHEDDAERAVRAGLRLVDAVGELRTAAPLHVRIGIATGLVVVGDLIGAGAAQEQVVVGETPNLAARLQTLAEPDTVVIAQSTQRLTGGLFEYEDLGAVEAKGFPKPVRAWRVLREGAAESRFEALHGGGASTPLVGREEEIDLLLRRWQQAKEENEGRVVLLSGEAGIGKSRITRAIQERLAAEAHTRLLYFCSPHHEASALHPFISQLERAAGFEREDVADLKLDKLERLLARSSRDIPRDAALLATLLSIPSGGRYAPRPDLSPQKRKEETLAAWLAQLEGLAASLPVLMILEDAHWIDATSLELLDRMVDRASRLPVLLIVTARPEFAPPWNGQPHVTVHPLSRLSRREGLAMVGRLVGGRTLPPEVVDQVITRTDGVPLFVEELTKAILESGVLRSDGERYLLTAPLPALTIPTTLHASLMARLDRLSPIRRIAEIGAAIGREFSHELITAVAETPESDVSDALQQLVTAELVYRRGTPPDAVYTFKHALVQDAAYSTLLRGARQQLHARIAKALEERFPEVAVTQPELLARHCAEGGLAERAVDYWYAAAERALRASANVEAIKHLSNGLRLLTSSLPEAPERDRKELRFQTTLGSTLLVTRGWGAPEAAQAYHRAEELCRALGDSSERFKIVHGLWLFHVARPEVDKARDLSDELFRIAEEQNDDELRLQAHHSASTIHTWLGEFTASREHTEKGLALYSPARHGAHALIYGGHDPGVCAWAVTGLDLWLLGYPDQAAEHVRQSVLLAEQIAHRPSVAHALNYGILCHQWRRDGAAVRQWGDRLAELAAEESLALHEATAVFARGWLLAHQGRAEASLADLRRGLGACIELGMRVLEPCFRASLAEAQLNAGQAAVGLEMLDDARRFAHENGLRYWGAELLRVRGDLLAHLSPGGSEPQEVEACYREALAVARRQQARSLELRAATSLARLWRDQGERAGARDLLAPVYGWFTEGFDTSDLKDAKALLDELS